MAPSPVDAFAAAHTPRRTRLWPAFGNDALGFLDPIQAGLAEVFLLGNSPDRIDVRVDITGNELAMATHALLQIDKPRSVADGTCALGHLFNRHQAKPTGTGCILDHRDILWRHVPSQVRRLLSLVVENRIKCSQLPPQPAIVM